MSANNAPIILSLASLGLSTAALSIAITISGQQGASGQQGVSGIQGEQGVSGQQGVSGMDGQPGVTGASGMNTGTSGTQGATGVSGQQGVSGVSGQQGVPGVSGIQGVSGEQGVSGIQGVSGEQGVSGIQGVSGQQGVSGVSGQQGVSGVSGQQGASGVVPATVVTNTANTSVDGNVVQFFGTTGHEIRDSTIASSNLFLADGSRPMTAPLDMGANNINNCGQIAVDSSMNGNCVFGENITFSGNEHVLIGKNITLTGPGNDCVIIGKGSSISNDGCTIVGRDNSAVSNAAVLGYANTLSSDENLAIGNNNTLTAQDAYAFGHGITNDTAHSLVIGDTEFVNIRTRNPACDLGTAAEPYRDLYLSTLRFKQGADATAGTGAVLVAGIVTVNTTAVQSGNIILLSRTATGGTLGFEYISAINDGVSFDISSSSLLDTSTFSWVIMKQA